MSRARIISGFPGVGKTTLFKSNKNLKIVDSDSSMFSWLEPGVRHPEFPNNYIEHIKKCMDEYDLVLVSSHKVVRDALREHGLEYDIFYPSVEDKSVYIDRYITRGNDKNFIKIVEQNWDSWIKEIDEETFPTKYRMKGNVFLKKYF